MFPLTETEGTLSKTFPSTVSIRRERGTKLLSVIPREFLASTFSVYSFRTRLKKKKKKKHFSPDQKSKNRDRGEERGWEVWRARERARRTYEKRRGELEWEREPFCTRSHSVCLRRSCQSYSVASLRGFFFFLYIYIYIFFFFSVFLFSSSYGLCSRNEANRKYKTRTVDGSAHRFPR